MLQPKRTKFKKSFKVSKKLKGVQRTQLSFGKFGIQAKKPSSLSSKGIETIRRILSRHLKRKGQVWIRIFPKVPVTSKPAEVRMGKGKGSVDHWVVPIQAGQILFEMDGIPLNIAKEACTIAQYRLSFPISFVTK
jgi:large subunit ribosomal protein L16